MLKHVGKHNNRKVAIVYKAIPGEDHMALVLYTDSLPSALHDEAMKVLESDVGQQAKEFADALFRHTMADGNNCLTTIHKMSLMKKVPTSQVIVTPSARATCRLDELNKILQKIEDGGEALKELEDMDKNRGIRGANPNNVTEGREVGMPKQPIDPTVPAVQESVNTSSGVLSDVELAKQRLDQATKMEAEANALLAEATRLKAEADTLAPKKATNVRKTRTTKKVKA